MNSTLLVRKIQILAISQRQLHFQKKTTSSKAVWYYVFLTCFSLIFFFGEWELCFSFPIPLDFYQFPLEWHFFSMLQNECSYTKWRKVKKSLCDEKFKNFYIISDGLEN